MIKIICASEEELSIAIADMVEQGWTSEGEPTQEGSDYVVEMTKEE